ncbi:hypothetical protein F4680DRAFT_403630 [Xylaria scruposa]|nr:hypothetical protein F4680DRAFT_403630 [Xylaria scruposa]
MSAPASPPQPTQSTLPTLPTRPLSPWAERFSSGLVVKNFTDSIWDKSLHSGLAPELPRFNDPIYYADMTGKLPIRDPPTSNEELDKLFRSEGYQTGALRGIRTWEAAILNRWVRFSAKTGNISAGHLLSDAGEYDKVLQDIFDSETIKVDESRWARWLRKEHWLNWVETSPLGGGEARTWTVDNEKIWSALRISLELVDRIFKTLIDERHDALQTLLFGRIELWRDAIPSPMGNEPYEDAMVLLSHSQEQYIARFNGIPCQYDDMTQHSESEWTQKLDDHLSLLLFVRILQRRFLRY